MSAVTVLPPENLVIDRAHTILLHAETVLPFLTGDALAAVTDRGQYLSVALGEHSRLVSEELDWRQYDDELWIYGDNAQRTAVAIAEDKVREAAKAAIRALNEYQPREAREAAMAGQGGTR